MTDPFYMLMLMENLGRDYVVWDKAAHIEFISPGQGTVHAEFKIDEDMLNTIREHTAAGEKYLPNYQVDVRDDHGTLVARWIKPCISAVNLKPSLLIKPQPRSSICTQI